MADVSSRGDDDVSPERIGKTSKLRENLEALCG
jgi:hypothetical protein